MWAARRHSSPALQVVNLGDAMCSFVQNEFPSLPAWEFLELLGLVLEQPRNPIGQICSSVKGLDWSAAQQHALQPFAFAQAWALPMQTFCVIWV